MACTSGLKDLWQLNVSIPLGIDHLPLLEWDRGHLTRFGEEDCDHLLGSTSLSVEFHRWTVKWEKPDLRLLLGLGVILVYKSLLTLDCVPELIWPASIKFLKHVKAPLRHTLPSYVPQLVCGHRTGITIPYTQVMLEDLIPASWWKIKTVFYFIFCKSWVIFD